MSAGDGPRRGRWWRDDSGTVTAEAAVALPALVLLVWAAVGAVAVATAQLRCVDAAREGARVAARGEGPAASRAVARRVAPPHADVELTRSADSVAVAVAAEVEPFGRYLPTVRVRGRSVAALEPGRPR